MTSPPRPVPLAAAILCAAIVGTAAGGDGPTDRFADRRAAPAQVPGLLAFWDFQEPAGADRVSVGRYQYPLAERNGPIARVEDGVFGPYAVDFALGQWMILPHAEAPGLDLHGEDQQVSMVAWVKRQSDRHWQYIGGMWNERDHARQYALFMSGAWQTDWTTYERVRADNPAMGYVSPLGGATPGHPFALRLRHRRHADPAGPLDDDRLYVRRRMDPRVRERGTGRERQLQPVQVRRRPARRRLRLHRRPAGRAQVADLP